ncbi:MAG: hypothetical protein IPM17_17565 [Verrucomicrobia bacterium]|nr:hypothetical protein [Verrucomicrobiota bacterium]
MDWLASCDAARAEMGYEWLLGYLTSATTADKAMFIADLKDHRAEHLNLLAKQISACKAIERFAFDVSKASECRVSFGDIHITYNESALFSILLQEYEAASIQDRTLAAIEQALRASLNRFLELSVNQIEVLCRFMLALSDHFKSLCLGNARVFLVDLPVGNSLIVHLLRDLLSPPANVQILRASLSRNDSRRVGVTRGQLLAELIGEIGVRPNDVIFYVDEWRTGANFHAICQRLQKLTPRGAFFFPAAVVAQDAARQARYQSYCTAHDEILQTWGVNGSDYRMEFPPLNSPIKGEGYFFWSEKDRMAGFRKLQLHGAILSSIHETLELLQRDKDRLTLTLAVLLGYLAPRYNLPGTPERALPMLIRMFPTWYKDYRECQKELEACAEGLAQGGEVENLRDELDDLVSVFGKVLNKRPAKMAMITATTYLQRFGSLDPADRYYFDAQAPVLACLEGTAATVHQTTVNFLKSRMQALRRS